MNAETPRSRSAITSAAQAGSCPPAPAIPGVTTRFEMPVTVLDGQRRIGKAPLRLVPEREPVLIWTKFAALIEPLLNKAALGRLRDALGDQDVVSLIELCRAGLPAKFNATKLNISLDIPLSFRRGGAIALRSNRSPKPEPDTKPAAYSAYANLYFGIDHIAHSDFSAPGWSTPDLAIDGALKLDDLVLEGEFSLAHDLTFERRTTRLVYDLPEKAMRFKLGDIRAPATPGAVQRDLLGFSVERSYSKLQPGKDTRPNAKRRFVVYQPSDVEVFVNGRRVRTFRLSPGEYDISDLPLITGGNKIVVKVKEDSGRTRTHEFTIFHGYALLRPGLSEWRLAGGFSATYTSEGRSYRVDRPALGGFFRHGITETMTGEIGGHLGSDGAVVNLALTTENWFGALFTRAAASYASGQLGYSLGIDWQFDDFDAWRIPISAIRVSGDYDSPEFALDQSHDDSGQYLNLGASIGFELPRDVSGFASLNYTAHDASAATVNTSLSLSKQVGSNASWNLSGAYRRGIAFGNDEAELAEWSLRFGFNYRFSPRARLSIDHDFAEGRTTASFDQSVRTRTASWMAEVDWVTDKSEQVGRRNENGLSAGLKYAGNRFTASLQHDRLFHGLGSEKLDIRSSATVSTAIAVADGRWGWGRPVGGAFAIIGLDPAVTGGRLDIAPTPEGAQARADLFGPALISGLTPYTANTITVAPEDLPADYDLGDGAFILRPTYKSGYALTAGVAGRIAIQGRLFDGNGQPLGLALGKARRSESGDGEGQDFFTTEDGRFFVSGLQPGLWRLSIKGRPDTRFVVTVPAKKKRIIDVGDVAPEE